MNRYLGITVHVLILMSTDSCILIQNQIVMNHLCSITLRTLAASMIADIRWIRSVVDNS